MIKDTDKLKLYRTENWAFTETTENLKHLQKRIILPVCENLSFRRQFNINAYRIPADIGKTEKSAVL